MKTRIHFLTILVAAALLQGCAVTFAASGAYSYLKAAG